MSNPPMIFPPSTDEELQRVDAGLSIEMKSHPSLWIKKVSQSFDKQCSEMRVVLDVLDVQDPNSASWLPGRAVFVQYQRQCVAQGFKIAENSVVLRDIHVAPCLQRKGIGSELLAFVKAYAKSTGGRIFYAEIERKETKADQCKEGSR